MLAINPQLLAMHVEGMDIAISTEATAVLDTAPAGGAQNVVSAFQGNLIYRPATNRNRGNIPMFARFFV
jgi:hypothetical protein